MRPAVHLTAPRGWINDPHGVTWHDGEYHLFHQYVPDRSAWAPGCHWGHATSTDLLTWQHRGIALAPDGRGDEVGAWSGCLVQDGDRARIFYTSVSDSDLALGRVRTATPTDASWTSWTNGPVVVEPPPDLDLIAFRDPCVVRAPTGWRMLVGASSRDGRALLLTWTSPDLEVWTYDGVARSRSTRDREPAWTGSLWECPQLVEVDGHQVLVVSVWEDDEPQHAAYAIGGRTAAWQRLSFGDSYYAPSFFRDAQGRPCLVWWMRGVGDVEEGWAGCLSVPHLASVRAGRLVVEPHPAVSAARARPLLPKEAATAFDMEWHPDPAGDDLGLTSGLVDTARLTVTDGGLTLARPGQHPSTVPWTAGPVRVVVDGPVVEVLSEAGVVGGAVSPTTGYRPGSGPCRAWVLRP